MSEENSNKGNEGEQTQVTPLINPDGTFGDLSKAPEGVGEFITSRGWKNFGAMAQSHKELEKKFSEHGDMIKIPEEGDTEAWRVLSTKLGCPEKAEDYTYEAKEGAPMDENLLSLFKQSAYKDGMPQKAFQDVVDFQIGAIVESQKMYDEKTATDTAEAQKAIRERFNTDDEYDAFTKKALGFADQFKLSDGTTTAADVLERKGLAYDPEILEVFGRLADTVNEDSLEFTKTRVTPNRDATLEAITKNPAFTDAMHVDHQKTMEAYWAIFKGEAHTEG